MTPTPADAACIFGPANEPWMCSVHVGGIRTNLTETRCRRPGSHKHTLECPDCLDLAVTAARLDAQGEAEAALTPPPAEPAPKMMLNGKMNPDYLAWNERRKALPPAEPMLDVKLLRQEVGKQLTDARVDGWVRGMSVPLHGREVSVDLQSRYLAATIRAAVLNIIDPLPDAKEPQP